MINNKRLLALLLSCILIISSFSVNVFAQEDRLYSTSDLDSSEIGLIYDEINYESDFVPGEVIVGLNQSNDVEVETFEQDINADIEVEKVEEFDTFDVDTDRDVLIVSLEEDTEQAVLDAVEKLKYDPNVAYVEPNYITSVAKTPNDTYYPSLWDMQKINMPSAWDITTGNPVVKVGVLDTGVDYTHYELFDNVDESLGYNFMENNSEVMDYNGHGTHVAGTVGAKGNNGMGVTGVNWSVTIIPIKVLDNSGNGNYSVLISGIYYANSKSLPIINISIRGTSYSQALKDAVDQFDGLLVAAAGNDYTNNDTSMYPAYPASFDCKNIISVANTTGSDTLANDSNYGATTVDLGAPGTNIYSTIPGDSLAYYSGTSMSAPHVAGAAALLLSFNKDLTTEELKVAILESVDKISSLSGKCVTGGRLNVYNALNYIADYKNIIYDYTDLISGQFYRFKNVSTNTYLTVGSSNTPALSSYDENNDGQQFTIEISSFGYYTISSKSDYFLIASPGGYDTQFVTDIFDGNLLTLHIWSIEKSSTIGELYILNVISSAMQNHGTGYPMGLKPSPTGTYVMNQPLDKSNTSYRWVIEKVS